MSVVAEAPPRMENGLDVSWQDVPYPVAPPFTRRGLQHLAVTVHGVFWNGNSSTRVVVDTRCGKKDMTGDRREIGAFPLCKVCYPTGGVA